MDQKIQKIVAIFVIIIVIANMILLGMQIINPITFWIVTGLAALIAFVIFPRLK